jgi:gamma-D-glutamyl-L-lysine dipeptidyl-peptidase
VRNAYAWPHKAPHGARGAAATRVEVRTATRTAAFAAAAAILFVPAGAGSARSRATQTYVAVSVATLWTTPDAPRALDAPALTRPVNIRRWSVSLDVRERQALVGKIETQALLGEPVAILARRGAWTKIAVPDQPTPRDARGYPGWVPTVQLVQSTGFARLLAGPSVVVRNPTAWLRVGSQRIEVSYGTRLPLKATVGPDTLVVLPDGRTGRLPRASATAYPVAAARGQPSPELITRATRRFLGTRYLWGGTSAFGFDCSGLIELVFRAHGIIVPRDADAQARGGVRVRRSALRPADAVFYGRPHVHHAALYIGGGIMIEAPNSTARVRLAPLRRTDFAGARRFLH